MRYFAIFALFILALVTACQQASTQTANQTANRTKNTKPSPTAAPHAEDEAQRISLKDAKAAYDSGNALFIDTRPESAYKGEHIKSAINIPAGETDKHIAELPKNKQLIFYCSWPAEHTSARAVLIANEKGLKNAAALLGGTDGWKNAGYPVEGDLVKK